MCLHRLTNEDSRLNWEMYGNPDGPGGYINVYLIYLYLSVFFLSVCLSYCLSVCLSYCLFVNGNIFSAMVTTRNSISKLRIVTTINNFTA